MHKALEVAKDSQGAVATRPAKQMPVSASRQNCCAILDAMEEVQTPNVLTMTEIEI